MRGPLPGNESDQVNSSVGGQTFAADGPVTPREGNAPSCSSQPKLKPSMVAKWVQPQKSEWGMIRTEQKGEMKSGRTGARRLYWG